MAPLIFILKFITLKLSSKDLIFVSKNNTIDRVDGGVSKIDRAKSQNMVISNFLAKFKLLVKSNSQSGFLTPQTSLAFVILKQALIELPIFFYLNPKCHICININRLGYIIDRVFSQ